MLKGGRAAWGQGDTVKAGTVLLLAGPGSVQEWKASSHSVEHLLMDWSKHIGE